jgi:hypothetical protein
VAARVRDAAAAVDSDLGVSPRGRRSPRARRLALAAGAVAAAAFVAGAALSGAMSPLARRPILDGTGPPPPYNYVSPPPGAQSTQRPSSGTFQLDFVAGRSQQATPFTSDVQLTLVAERGMIEADRGDTGAKLQVEPLDPATVGPIGGGLEAQGNVYRIRATLEPSAEPVRRFAVPSSVILVYPAQPGVHRTHEVLFSPDGRQWTPLETTDAPSYQQASARIDRPGYVVVAAPAADGGGAPSTTGGGSSVVVWVVVASIVLIGLGLATRFLSRGRGGNTGSDT